MRKIFFLLIIITSVYSAQNASDYFPSSSGHTWYYRITPLDSLNFPILNMAVLEKDSFAVADGQFHGRQSHLMLSKTAPAGAVDFIDYADSVFYSFEGGSAFEYVNFPSFLDSAVIPDSSIIYLLRGYNDWYGMYPFSTSVGQPDTIFQADTTISFDTAAVPVRIEVTTVREEDEFLSTEVGNFTCKKFTVSVNLYYILELPPPFPNLYVLIADFPNTYWIAEDNWIVRQYSPSASIDLSNYGIPRIYVPGLEKYVKLNPVMITLFRPTGGEKFPAGGERDILWLNRNGENVKIEYSVDSGGNWNPVASGLAGNTGVYQWTIPDIQTDNARIRISDMSDPFIWDESMADFSIVPAPELNLTSPSGGETIEGNTQFNLVWSSLNSETLKIEFTSDNGDNWSVVDESIPAGNNSYSWTAPDISSSECKIKISDDQFPEYYSESGVFTVTPSTGVKANDLPVEYSLLQNYPNPFNPATKIEFTLKEEGPVKLAVFNVLGEKVSTLVNGEMQSGKHTISFDGSLLSSGVYFYRLSAGDKIFVKKMILSQ